MFVLATELTLAYVFLLQPIYSLIRPRKCYMKIKTLVNSVSSYSSLT